MQFPKINKPNYTIKVFDGGLVTKIYPAKIMPNQSPDLSNVQFNDFGNVETVDGSVNLNSAGIAAQPITGLGVYKASATATEYLIVACNGNVYRTAPSPPTSAAISAITGGTGTVSLINNVCFLNFQNKLFYSDGVNQGYKIAGNEISQAGIRPVANSQASIVSTVSVAISHPVGTYDYRITGVNGHGIEGGETILGQYILIVLNKTINLTSIPVYPASANVITRNIYCREPGSTSYKYEATIPDNTTTSYVDSTGVSATAPALGGDLGPMPKHKFACEYQGFGFCAGDDDYPTRLYFSEQGNPENFPPANYIDIGEGDNLPISGLVVYNGMVNIHKNDGYGEGCIYVLNVPNASLASWSVVKTNAKNGCIAGRSLIGSQDKSYFLTKTGLYRFFMNFMSENPQYTTLGNFIVDSLSWDIEPNIYSLSLANMYKACAVNYKNKIIISAPDKNPYNDTVLVYDLGTVTASSQGRGVWSVVSGNYSSFVVYKGSLIAGSSLSDGKIYNIYAESVKSFDSQSITSYYNTAFIYGDDKYRENFKDWRYFIVVMKNTGNYDIQVGYRTDPSSSFLYNNVTMVLNASVWGTMVWGTDSWGSIDSLKQYIGIFNAPSSKMIQFSFKASGVDVWFSVSELSIYYNIRGIRRG